MRSGPESTRCLVENVHGRAKTLVLRWVKGAYPVRPRHTSQGAALRPGWPTQAVKKWNESECSPSQPVAYENLSANSEVDDGG